VDSASSDERKPEQRTPTRTPTNTWLRHYKKWAKERGFESNTGRVPKSELDGNLQQFYAELIKSN